MQQIRAISFDLDDTLWAITPVIERAEAALRAWLDEHYPRVTRRYSPRSMQRVRDKMLLQHAEFRHDMGYLRRTMLRHLLEGAGYGDEGVDRAFACFQEARNEVALYEDVLPALAQLQERYRLLALSNGNADLSRIGIDAYFSHSIHSATVGVAKPHPRIFAVALEHLGLKPEEVLHVGDDPVADVQGGRTAGMVTAWLNRGSAQWPDEHERAHLEIRDLHDLLRALN